MIARKGWKIICCVCMIVLFYACNKALTVNDFFKKVSEDKAYKKELSIGEFNLKCEYRPSELICLSELTKGQNAFKFKQSVFKEELKKYENGCYIDLTIGLKNRDNVMIKGVNSQQEYAARLGELTYLLTQDCYIISDGKDTVKALVCNFSNTYGNSPDTKILFVFPKKEILESKNSIEVVYADKTFGISEKALFKYDASEIKKEVPKIIEQK